MMGSHVVVTHPHGVKSHVSCKPHTLQQVADTLLWIGSLRVSGGERKTKADSARCRHCRHPRGYEAVVVRLTSMYYTSSRSQSRGLRQKKPAAILANAERKKTNATIVEKRTT